MIPPSVLVIGGAGKFGSEVAKIAAETGARIISVDNLSTGDQSRLIFGPLLRCSDHETAKINRAISEYDVQHIFQCAMDATPLSSAPSATPGTVEAYHRAISATLNGVHLAQTSGVLSLTIFQKKSQSTEALERILQDCSAAIKKSLTLIQRPMARDLLSQKIQMIISGSRKGE